MQGNFALMLVLGLSAATIGFPSASASAGENSCHWDYVAGLAGQTGIPEDGCPVDWEGTCQYSTCLIWVECSVTGVGVVGCGESTTQACLDVGGFPRDMPAECSAQWIVWDPLSYGQRAMGGDWCMLHVATMANDVTLTCTVRIG